MFICIQAVKTMVPNASSFQFTLILCVINSQFNKCKKWDLKLRHCFDEQLTFTGAPALLVKHVWTVREKRSIVNYLELAKSWYCWACRRVSYEYVCFAAKPILVYKLTLWRFNKNFVKLAVLIENKCKFIPRQTSHTSVKHRISGRHRMNHCFHRYREVMFQLHKFNS